MFTGTKCAPVLVTRFRSRVRSGPARLRTAAPALVQVLAAVLAAYTFAHDVLRHPNPAIAVTVTISSLTLNRDARPGAVLRTAIAMNLGIAVSATAVVLAGRGTVQLIAILVVVMSAALLVSSSPSFVVSAATQATLVAVLTDPPGGPYTRALDGIVGGMAALLVMVTLPAPVARRARAAYAHLLSAIAAEIDGLAVALRTGDLRATRAALERIRALDRRVRATQALLDAAGAASRLSPFRRSQRDGWATLEARTERLDLAVRNLRVIARRACVVVERSGPQTHSASACTAFADHVRALLDGTPSAPVESVAQALNGNTGDLALATMLRPLAVDLLEAGGLTHTGALAVLLRKDSHR